jgi:dTDP-4-dehydrorhamnose 3,5-epimerase|tara:strand:+ start:5545 stop:6054 length:510 start_codon:yes stop_codon:yes gene_type:complete
LKPKIQEYDLGIKKISINLHHDDRGFLGEIFRQDWNDIIPDFIPKQFLISQSKPGIIRAWHRHLKNQIDILFVRKGKLKICAYDGDKNSKSYGKLVQIICDSKNPEMIMVPGHLWHGTKNISDETSETIYLINNLYDYETPDEERKNFDDSSIIDPKTKKTFDWNKEEP